MPLTFIPPQLATASEEIPRGEGWVHEIAFDGYRVLGFIGEGEPRLLSRKTLDWSGRFREVVTALKSLRAKDAIVDGEVCVLDANGRSDSAALKALVEKGKAAPLAYLVFDLLWLDGEDLRGLPLLKRKARLQKILPKGNAIVQYVEHFTGDALKFFSNLCEAGLEGIVAKQADAPYESGPSRSWIEVKCVDAREFAVVGYVPSDRRSYFRSLIVADATKDGPVYRGLVGAGFTEGLGKKVEGMLTPLKTDTSPLEKVPWELRSGPVQWVRPEYFIMVRFTEITREGVLRHPRFVRIRHKSEPGVAEHLRSRTMEDRKPRKRRARPPEAETDQRSALVEALRKSAGAPGRRRGARKR